MVLKPYHFVFLVMLLNACSQQRYALSAKEVKTSTSMRCIDMFWGYDIEKRGNTFIFRDSDFRVITRIEADIFDVDTIIKRPASNPFGNLKETNEKKFESLSRCLSTLDVRRVRGFNQDFQILEFTVDDHLVLYYAPDHNSLPKAQLEKIEDKGKFIDEDWFYLIKKGKHTETIW